MTSRLYQECLGCEAPNCWGCAIIDNKVKEVMSRIDAIGQNGGDGLHYEEVEATGGSTPSQYGIPDGTTDLQDLIEHRDMSFALGNIFKACYRYGKKNDNLYELNKMKWFIDRLIAEEKRNG